MNDRLGGARQLLRAAAGVTLAAPVLVAAVALLARAGLPGADPRPALVRATATAGLSLLPAGRPLRSPEVRHAALDPRHVPELPAALEPGLAAAPAR